MFEDKEIEYKLKKPVEILSKRVQEKIDAENTFEPKKSDLNKRQKDYFEFPCPALLCVQD